MKLNRRSDYLWEISPFDNMIVPVTIFADSELIQTLDEKVYEQAINVARLPGIVGGSFVMPDGHWGYGFPIGGVAAFDAEQGGVVSAGGVGFDISCGVRTLLTGLNSADVEALKEQLADYLYYNVPAGLGSRGEIHLGRKEMEAMLHGGAKWAVSCGYGDASDLLLTEEQGRMQGADPENVSDHAVARQQDEMGTLGSGNHYLEVQKVVELFDREAAIAFGLRLGEVVVSIHCGSRGLGHQIGTEYLREMVISAAEYGITLPDRELACAPIYSELGQRYLGAMRAGINCAMANRQIITELTRRSFYKLFPDARLELLYDVSHNTCKVERHEVDGRERELFVHRKGATRAFGPGHSDVPEIYREVGQPVLIGGSMGSASYILAGTSESESLAFSSSCHGAGRAMSRRAAKRKWRGEKVLNELAYRGIVIRCPSMRGVAEEAPGAYKDVSRVVDVAEQAGLSRKVARLEPLICIKG